MCSPIFLYLNDFNKEFLYRNYSIVSFIHQNCNNFLSVTHVLDYRRVYLGQGRHPKEHPNGSDAVGGSKFFQVPCRRVRMHVKRSQKWGESVRMTYAYPNFFANILLIRGVRMTSSEPSFEPIY